MKRIALALLLSAAAGASLAADNAVTVTVGSGTTMRSKDVGAGVQSMIQVLGDTSGNPMTFIGTNQTAPGNAIVIGGVVGTANTVSGNASPFFIDTSGNLKTTLGTATVTTSGLAGTNLVAPHLVVGSGTFTTSAIAGSNFVGPVAVGGTVTVSNLAGSLAWPGGTHPVTGVGTFTTSGIAASNFIAPVAIGSAPTLVVSNSSGFLVQPVNCINGCSASNISGTYNQSTATSVSGGTQGLQLDQRGALKVNITSQLASALTVSEGSGNLMWPPGTPTGLAAGTATANQTGSIIMAEGSTGAVPIASGSTSFLTMDLNSNLKTSTALTAPTTGGCTGTTVTASTMGIFTQIKASAGTLCWMRIINASTTTASVRLYDSAINGNFVCSGLGTPTSIDMAQPRSTSPGMVSNMGTYGQAFSNGIGICITGDQTGTSATDTTSLTTTSLVVNLGYK